MKSIFNKIGDGIKSFWKTFPKFYLIIILSSIVGGLITYLITDDRHSSIFVSSFILIGLFLIVILYVWLRQIYWFITGKGDYKGRIGFFKKLWNKLFK